MDREYSDKNKKIIFWIAVAGAFFAIALFNFLTPVMSDDYSYSATVRAIHSIGELIKSEYEQYLSWTGRSVNHLTLKIFLKMDKWVFNLCNSIEFMILSFLIYYNIEGKKRFDTPLFILIHLFLWIFSVQFKETILWETGACNYLWGTTNVLLFVTLFKYVCKKRQGIRKPYLWSLLLFFAGVIAGWCNENTSGGGILLILAALYMVWREDKKIGLWMWTGPVGMLTGFVFMIAAPGNRVRAQYAEDNYGGILKYIARAYKITLAIEENFFILLLMLLVLLVLVRVQKRTWKELENGLLYFLVFVATCYALVMAPTPMNRAYFGAGMFLIIAVLQLFVMVTEEETLIRVCKTSLIGGLFLYMIFFYVDNVVDTARVYRDYHNRDRYIREQKAEGKRDITVPLLHEGFESVYSFGYDSDFDEDSGYWINVMAALYYEVDSISGIPMEEWTEY